ncbi:uncharacterized protein TRIVIDRAFT_66614 [Trichoderma virens Gv29-8]|uniref:Uncharacterized protein n=1 Tax=Hypocrea virens (strain Gv29-8 / FGSC 10586) TaxID=413071 RepID=G9N6F0_HYPVG|nr:uncharacterized protein TRIVIDRAFT_66614 [Trichoderma virens Gv29-8]EHK17711.1 hypothetical protein TRIVIDRAFT_66614 [Trichoderma virens Gv29-8]UKZ53575.1 hypothetical protein TrVGV298_007370 [Trichoderma virens]
MAGDGGAASATGTCTWDCQWTGLGPKQRAREDSVAGGALGHAKGPGTGTGTGEEQHGGARTCTGACARVELGYNTWYEVSIVQVLAGGQQAKILLAGAQQLCSVLVHASERPDGKDLRGATEQWPNPKRRVCAAGATQQTLTLGEEDYCTVEYEYCTQPYKYKSVSSPCTRTCAFAPTLAAL